MMSASVRRTLICGTLTWLTIATPCLAADVEFRFERGWPIISWRGTQLTRGLDTPAVSISVDEHELPGQITGDSQGQDSASYTSSAGTIVDEMRPFGRLPNCTVRQVRFSNRPDGQCDVTGAVLRVAPESFPNAPTWQAQSFAMIQCGEQGPTLCVAYTSDEDTFHVQWKQDEPIEHRVNAAWRLPANESAVIGSQYIWVVDGDLASARRTAQLWYDAVGLTVADNGPDWFRDCILYQASAGGSVDSRFGDVGGFDNFSRQLDYIADLGCNAFWLMSVHTHKDPAHPLQGWNLYGPRTYDEVDPAYGGADGLKALVAHMRDRGFHVLGEIVPHGGTAELPASHPEWWTYGRDGKRVNVFGQSPDYSHPGWQAAIGSSIEQLTRQFGFEGYRVDVAPGFGINWRSSPNAPHVSRSTMGGAIGMLKAIRDGALAGGAQQPAIIPESRETPEYSRFGPIGYGFPLIRLLEQHPPAALSAAELNRCLREFFASEQDSLPRGMILLRTLNNHDTVVDHGRADRRFGVGLQRALTAVCTLVEGVPMLYQEQEVGSYDYFRQLFWARRRLPELSRGQADYLSVQAAPEVFTVLRSLDQSCVVGLVNLSSQTISTAVQLPDKLSAQFQSPLREVLTGKSIEASGGHFRWELAPYATAIFQMKEVPLSNLPAERHRVVSPDRAENSTFTWQKSANNLRFAFGTVTGQIVSDSARLECQELPDGRVQVTMVLDPSDPKDTTIRFEGVERWRVQSVTGDYEDRLLRRHYPWPNNRFPWTPSQVWGHEPHTLYRGILPPGRVWQSAVAPMADGGAICLTGSSGKGLVLRGIDCAAQNNIVLADSAAADRAADSDLPADGMSLTFLRSDPALHPNWMPPWRSAGWLMEVPDKSQSPASQITFTIGPINDLRRDVPPVALTPMTDYLAPSMGAGKHHIFQDRLWLEEPNTVSLSPVLIAKQGTYWLWVQLRHSERAATQTELTPHYQISWDGELIPFTWEKLDVYHTGNGYFGWAKLNLGSVQPSSHSLTLQTTHSWCAVRRLLLLTTDESFVPQ